MTLPFDHFKEILINLFQSVPHFLLKHQIESYNDFIRVQFPILLQQYNPILIYHNYNEQFGKYETELRLFMEDLSFSKPLIHENNGSTKEMTPSDARLRNLSYQANIYITLRIQMNHRHGDRWEECSQEEKILKEILIGKIPIMLQSCFCVLQYRKHDECPMDKGGYFIINGSEKVIICQERQVENKVYCFKTSKSSKYSHVVDIKSMCNKKFLPAKSISLKLLNRSMLCYGKSINVVSSPFRQDIPLFIFFRALGVESDKQILEFILLDLEDPLSRLMMSYLSPSLEEAQSVTSQSKALEYLSKIINISNYPKEMKMDLDRKVQVVRDYLCKDFLPHLGNGSDFDIYRKCLFLGYMTRRLLLLFLGLIEEDDRDSYAKKRLDTPGTLMSILTRQYITKMIKDTRNAILKEMNIGCWKYSKKLDDLITSSNIYKLIKSTTMESGIKYALATGNWGIKNITTKVGVAQVLNRLSYYGTLSHLRRINTPMEKSSKLIAPRKLHGTSWGYVCPVETPEGAPIGIVKNLAMGCEITSYVCDESLVEHCRTNQAYFTDIQSTNRGSFTDLHHAYWVFSNGVLIGITFRPPQLVEFLRDLRRKGILHIHTSISIQYHVREVHLQTDGGRVIRPLFIASSSSTTFPFETIHYRLLKEKVITWNHLISGFYHDRTYYPGIIEYIDAQEAENILIQRTTSPRQPVSSSSFSSSSSSSSSSSCSFSSSPTHFEIDPSLILGVMAACIPFSDHNQSPRNTYQSAMGKQAMGIYNSKFLSRFDTMANILSYGMRPLVQTLTSKIVNGMYDSIHEFPTGCNVIVAIACYTGFNQEDSIIINQNAIDRGLFQSTFYRCYKDEEKKNQASGEEEKFQCPDPHLTKGLRPCSYATLDIHGLPVVNKAVRGGDAIIGKVIPMKKQEKYIESKIYRDQSTLLRFNENGIIDNTYSSRNGDGYRFYKVRVRDLRIPVIGDKFSSRHGQKGTVGMVYRQEDMPFTMDGIVPDIILNPHAIPSRMTIAQLFECLMGKACIHLGMEGDGTPFNKVTLSNITNLLQEHCNLHPYGNEILYNGITGEQLKADIFIGPTYYQRLKHMVDDKIHSRSTGPLVMLTRQPAEGRARDGGLRIGEMERDCLISHGSSKFLKERMMDLSDNYKMFIGSSNGLISAVNREKCIARTFDTLNTDSEEVRVPYAFKLLFQELQAMGIAPRLLTDKNVHSI